MPIVRTYGCGDCGRFIEVTLTMEQVDDPPPECPHCAARAMRQEFKPIAIGGSTVGKAVKLAETIAAEDYGVADMQHDTRHGGRPKVRYKDQGNTMQQAQVSTWGVPGNALETAMAIGRQTRMANGGYSGVDTLQRMLKDGTQADLIEVSKQRSMRVW
jgi:DNA-directed RNA polymerase subunit RPC12/RpoP